MVMVTSVRVRTMAPRCLLAASALVGLASGQSPTSVPVPAPTSVPTSGPSSVPTPAPTSLPIPAPTLSPTDTPDCDSTLMTATYDGTTYTGANLQLLIETLWNSTKAEYDNVVERWENEREMWESEETYLSDMNEIKCGLEYKNSTIGNCKPHWKKESMSEKVLATLKVAESYNRMIDVVATLTGALFLYVAKFGYLARTVGMVTVTSMKTTIVFDILTSSLAVLAWWSLGYGLAFGKDNYPESGDNGLYGGDNFFSTNFNDLSSLIGGGDDTTESAKTHADFLLHLGLSLICVGIPVGTLAERATIQFTILSATILGVVIYPVVAHVFWDENGWFSPYREKKLLFDCGVVDTAGAGVVHTTGAVVALAAAVIIDARRERWTMNEDSAKPVLQPKPQYSPAFEAFGCVIVFVTSIATTAFCVREFTEDGPTVGRAIINNLICSGTSAFTACVFGHYYTGVVSPQLAGGGMIAGIATIASGCAVVTPEGAFIMGFVGGIAYYMGGALLITIRVDDVSHAISMHGFAGVVGLIMTGLFADPVFYEQAFYDTRYYDSGCYGMFYNGGPTAVLTQSYGAMTIIAYAGTISTLVFGIYHLAIGGRFPEKMLEQGLDSCRMGGETSYTSAARKPDPLKYAKIHGGNPEFDD
mmetsp:Transcript_55605/g.153475  ORF Transcript_55605/g.153475 Transcript_55605/m.153475 type:complete len:645 (+) Transcript_55605:162-2096(+)